MLENNPGNPSGNPQVSPPASAQPKPQPAPAAQPASPVPQKPEVKKEKAKKEEAKKEEAKKKEKHVSVRPNFLLCAVFQALNLFILAVIIILVLRFVGVDIQEDVIGVMRETFDQLVATSEELGGIPLFGMLLGQLRDTFVFAFIQIVAVAMILQIPVVNNHWKLFSDRLEYKKGFIILRTKTISFSDVRNVSFKRYTPFADFGKVTIETSGGEGKGISMPYVFHASKLTTDINNKVKQHQMKEVAAKVKKAQAAPAGTPPQKAESQPGQTNQAQQP